MDAVRKRLARAIKERTLSYKQVSLEIGKNHAYVQQFIERGVPAKLAEDVRSKLSELLDIPEDELGAPQTGRGRQTAETGDVANLSLKGGLGLGSNFSRRLDELRAGNPLPFTVLAKRTIPYAGLLITEAWMHDRFAARRAHGEWFLISPDDALAALPEAERFARAYARCCRDWFQRDIVQRMNDGTL